ncbi:unnamed protein product, partial [Natator depressus]
WSRRSANAQASQSRQPLQRLLPRWPFSMCAPSPSCSWQQPSSYTRLGGKG